VRTDLDHLPDAKRRELERVVQLIFEEFEDATKLAQQGWKKQARILKIILFGSHARGGWVDEPHTAKGYQSDYDLLIVVSHEKLIDRATYWSRADERLIRERDVTHTLKTPVTFVVHTLAEVNAALSEGRYFFTDIARDGVVLYQSDSSELIQPRPKAPADALALAREYADEWLPTGDQFLRQYRHAVADGAPKIAVFDLHQAAERLYHGLLLTLTFYTPHTHRLAVLRSQAERLDVRLIDAWPREARTDRARFEKLKEAYIKARYSKHYTIDNEDLAWLGERVEALGTIVKTLCDERIASLEKAARESA
jgi:predicted nucleotidyltransferase/HEPN domain-containing protein